MSETNEILEMDRPKLIQHIAAIDDLIEKTDRERKAAEDIMCAAVTSLKQLREERRQAEFRLNVLRGE